MTSEERAEKIVIDCAWGTRGDLQAAIAAAIDAAVEEATEIDRHRIMALIEKQAELMSALAARPPRWAGGEG